MGSIITILMPINFNNYTYRGRGGGDILPVGDMILDPKERLGSNDEELCYC